MRNQGYMISLLLLLMVILGSVQAAVEKNGQSSDLADFLSSGQTITILDDRGQYITIPYPVKNVVFLVENAMNSMYAIGGADKISGIGNIWMPEKKEPFFREIDPNYESKPKVKTENGNIDLEALKAADPDLVVLWSSDWDDNITATIKEKLKVPVYSVYYTKLSDVSRAINVYAKIIGAENREAEVSSIMGEYTRKVTDKTSILQDDNRPAVYWMWGDIYGTAGLNSATNELIRLSGGKNVIESAELDGKMSEHPVVSMEMIQKLNPDVIYLWYNEKIDPSDVMSGQGEFAEWKNLNAVKKGRVYEVSDPFVFDSFSPQQPLALMAIAKNLHPELFTDVNLDELIDSFFVQTYSVHYPELSAA